MSRPKLALTIGQHSDKGRKEANQDFHGALLPDEPLRGSKGVAVALADGISSSEVGHLAAQLAVHSFLDDYYCTSEAWSVKTSTLKTLAATNAWLYSQTQQGQGRFDKDRGHVCTFSGIVFKSTTAHLFHIGDGRITLLRGGNAEPLTQEHRVVVSEDKSYLSRAFGIHPQLDIDYRTVALEAGDVFAIATDGVHEYVEPKLVLEALTEHGDKHDAAAAAITAAAFARGSSDNLTVQLVRVDGLPRGLVEPLCGDGSLFRKIPLARQATGYVRHSRLPMPDRLQSFNLFLRLDPAQVMTPEFLDGIDPDEPFRHMRRTWNECPDAAFINRMLAYDWRYTLADSDLPKVRGATAMAGIEVGYPLLDDRLVDFSMVLEPEWKLRRLKLPWFVKEALRGVLTEEIITKKKQGFDVP